MAANTNLAVATHAMVALSHFKERINSEMLAKGLNTNPVVIRKILSKLVRAGLVHSVTGKHGGFSLEKSPTEITLSDIQSALDETALFAIPTNAEYQGCRVSCTMKGILANVFEAVENAVGKELKKVTLADLVNQVEIQ